jgi:hypothetical protein
MSRVRGIGRAGVHSRTLSRHRIGVVTERLEQPDQDVDEIVRTEIPKEIRRQPGEQSADANATLGQRLRVRRIMRFH